jgi:Arc/MetJ-type ribon-helix-helix transcriptional regulator
MAKSTVITFRCEDDILEQIDALVRKHHYYKRSQFIQAGLQLMIELDKEGLAQEALSYYPKWDEVVDINFERRRKVKV